MDKYFIFKSQDDEANEELMFISAIGGKSH